MTHQGVVIGMVLVMVGTLATALGIYVLAHVLITAARLSSKNRLLDSPVMGNILKKFFGTRCDFEGCRVRLADSEGIRWQGIAFCSREHADLAVATSTTPQ